MVQQCAAIFSAHKRLRQPAYCDKGPNFQPVSCDTHNQQAEAAAQIAEAESFHKYCPKPAPDRHEAMGRS